MNTLSKKSKLGLAALAVVIGLGGAVAAAGPSLAQRMGYGGPGHIDGKIAYLKTELKITDAQAAQWATFEQALRQNADAAKARMEKMRADFQKRRAERQAQAQAQGQNQAQGQRPARPQVSAVDQIQRRIDAMKTRETEQERVLTALKPLYASFSPEQKQVADQLLAGHGHGFGHGPHRGMNRL